MIDQKETKKIKELVEEFFEKMTTPTSSIEVEISSIKEADNSEKPVVKLDIKMEEPQILIGQGGQTLFEIQRLLRMVLNKKLQDVFYLNLDINNYKEQKVDYLKDIVKDIANQVALTKKEKALSPMSAYERRVVHAELSQRSDVVTESQGDRPDRHIVIKPK